MTVPGRASGLPALLARLLTDASLLDRLVARDLEGLRRDLHLDPAQLAVIAAIDVAALRFYLRRLQRKRLEIIEPFFPASLPAARAAHGADLLAAGFWWWYRLPASASPDEVPGAVAAEWTRFAAQLAGRGAPGWLGELSRYEMMRWRAVSLAAPRPARQDDGGGGGYGRPVPAPGTGVGTFAVDVTLLLRTAMEGNPVASPAVTRLMTWRHPTAGLSTVQLGAALYAAVLACDGTRTIDMIAARVGAERENGSPRLAAALRALVQAGALCVSSGGEVPAQRRHPRHAQRPDGAWPQ